MRPDESVLGKALLGVYDVTLRTTEAVAPTLEKHGLSFNSAYVLWAIDPTEPPPSMRALARRTRCTPPNLTFLCDQLESRDLVTRERGAADRRQRVVSLTPSGRAARAAVVDTILGSSPLGTLSSEDLLELLRIVGSIEADPEGGG